DGTTDIVTGIVLMQKFERTMDVVQRVRAAVARMNADGTLPPGVHIDAFYDRGDLVAITVRTVLNNMLFGVVLIFLIQWMFLGDLRSALIVSATIPVALFLAVIITVLRGESANLLSIGALLLPERVTEVETFVVRQIRKVYQFVLPLAVRRYRLSAMIALAFLAICGLLASRLGTEFLPKLEEGNLWIRGMMPPTMALD